MFIIPVLVSGYFVLPSIKPQTLTVFVLLVTIVGSLWDLWATRHGKRDPVWIWAFNHKDTIGIRLLGLPIEEYLFYIFSSVYVVFIWKTIELASETGNGDLYLIIPALGVWTLISIAIPYKLSPKRDRMIG